MHPYSSRGVRFTGLFFRICFPASQSIPDAAGR
jgi:hypothetical protein